MNQVQASSTAPQESLSSCEHGTKLLHSSLLCLSVSADEIYDISLRRPSWRRLNPQIPNDLTFNKCHKTSGPISQYPSLFGLTDEYGQNNIDYEGVLRLSDDSLVNQNDSSHSLHSNCHPPPTMEPNINLLHSPCPQNYLSHQYSMLPLNQDDYSMSISVPPAMLPSIPPAFSPIELDSSMPTPQAFPVVALDSPPPTPVTPALSSNDLESHSPMPMTGPQAFSPVALDSPPPTPVLPALSSADISSSMPMPPSLPVSALPSVASDSGSPLTCIDPSLLNITTPAQATTSTLTRNQEHHPMSLDGAPQPQGLFLMVPFYPYPYPATTHIEPVVGSSSGQGNHVGPPF